MKAMLLNLLIGFGVILLLLAAVVSTSPASYLYCLSKEGSWLESETRGELEGKLGVYSSKEIKADADGRKSVRYLVLYTSPLVVSYAHDEKIENIFLEYE
jgi:hypothetical protein